MMREILFRGKRVDNGEWVQGFFAIWGDDYYISPDINAYTSMGGRGKGRCMLFGRYYQVLPETVGQHTGLTDKNGKKIFEGDIIHIDDNKLYCFSIDFYEGSYECQNKKIETFKYFRHRLEYDKPKKYEIIGNIHDNPELLEDNNEN